MPGRLVLKNQPLNVCHIVSILELSCSHTNCCFLGLCISSGAMGWTAGVWFPAEIRLFSTPQRPERPWVITSQPVIPRDKATEAWKWHLLTFRAEVRMCGALSSLPLRLHWSGA
jgi:hypothetical protein